MAAPEAATAAGLQRLPSRARRSAPADPRGTDEPRVPGVPELNDYVRPKMPVRTPCQVAEECDRGGENRGGGVGREVGKERDGSGIQREGKGWREGGKRGREGSCTALKGHRIWGKNQL